MSCRFQVFVSGAQKYVQNNNYDGKPRSNRKTDDSDYYTGNIPSKFDARQYFVKCAKVIGDVKDQGNCASSWVNSLLARIYNFKLYLLHNVNCIICTLILSLIVYWDPRSHINMIYYKS